MKNIREKIENNQKYSWDDVEYFHCAIERLRDVSVDFWNDAPGVDSKKIDELENVVRELRARYEIMMS